MALFFVYVSQLLGYSGINVAIDFIGGGILFGLLSLLLLNYTKDNFSKIEIILKYILLGIITIVTIIPIGKPIVLDEFGYWFATTPIIDFCIILFIIITVVVTILCKKIKWCQAVANILLPLAYLMNAVLYSYPILMVLSVAMLGFNIISLRKIIPRKQPQE